MSDEIVSVEVSKLSVTYRSYQALQRLRSCFVLGPVELHSRLLLSMAFGIYTRKYELRISKYSVLPINYK